MEEITSAFKHLSPKIESGVGQEGSPFVLWIQSKERLLLVEKLGEV